MEISFKELRSGGLLSVNFRRSKHGRWVTFVNGYGGSLWYLVYFVYIWNSPWYEFKTIFTGLGEWNANEPLQIPLGFKWVGFQDCRISLICLNGGLVKSDSEIQPSLKFLLSDWLKNNRSWNTDWERKKISFHGADRWRKNTEVFCKTKKLINEEKLIERAGIKWYCGEKVR